MQVVSRGQRETGLDVNQVCVRRVTRRREVVATGKQRVERVELIVSWILVPRSGVELQTDSWPQRSEIECSADNCPDRPRVDSARAYASILGHGLGVPIEAAARSCKADIREV